MALHLLERDRDGGQHLSEVLAEAMERIGRCAECRNLTEQPVCAICTNDQRDRSQLCVVESPSDVIAIENATGFRGLYFVLMGRLSPLDGIGPAELGLDLLQQRLQHESISEIILATNPTASHSMAKAALHGGRRPLVADGDPTAEEDRESKA